MKLIVNQMYLFKYFNFNIIIRLDVYKVRIKLNTGISRNISIGNQYLSTSLLNILNTVNLYLSTCEF